MAIKNVGAIRFLLIGGFEDSFPETLLTRQRLLLKQVRDIRSAIALLRTETFDCVIVDRNLEDGDGIVLAPTIRRASPHSISVLISADTAWATVEAAKGLGYSEVLPLSFSKEELRVTIEFHFSRNSQTNQERRSTRPSIHLLTMREREILLDLATGARNEEIASSRHVSVATIKSHLSSIYRKLGVRNRTEAMAVLRDR